MDDGKQSIARSFDAVLRTLDLPDRVGLELMRQLFLAKLDVVIARRQRKCTLESSVASRLPNEIWSAIWQDSALHLDDQIRFSQVCQAWRTFALLSPRLWRDVSFRICWLPCQHESLAQPRFKRKVPCEHVTCPTISARRLDLQFARLEALLPRSSPLAFNLKIWTVRGHDVTDWIGRFAQTLSPHTRRIGRMYMSVHGETTLPVVMGLLQALPGLRELAAITRGSSLQGSLSLTPDLMPQVQKLNLFNHYLLLSETARMHSVRELSFTFASAEDLLRTLQSFPNLETLSLALKEGVMDMATFRLHAAEIRQLAAPLTGISLVHVYSGCEDPFLDVFYRPSRQNMTIEFWDSFAVSSFRTILGGMKEVGGVKLIVSCYDGKRLLISAQTDNCYPPRQRRILVYNMDHDYGEIKTLLTDLWDYFPLSAVDVLDFDAYTWAAMPVYRGPVHTTHLCLVLRPGSDWFTTGSFTTDSVAFPWSGPHPARFPLLRRLSILGPEGTEVAAESLLAFIEALGLGPDEQSLEVELQGIITLVGNSTDLYRRCNVYFDANRLDATFESTYMIHDLKPVKPTHVHVLW
ncbi:hypothetical protein EXIGLDRAFT_730269 [Exidia glandulosa HHB12029]|uniref:Uncharacterized protein n=1 Tax=Exidia glandulosa HHB12029 TaxID=1314781 RepID=A0A165LAJ1_EXIGL|nr:hypothetical protein EXIGLDRAFT_730269 [Exidia glandulosa HHB12029]